MKKYVSHYKFSKRYYRANSALEALKKFERQNHVKVEELDFSGTPDCVYHIYGKCYQFPYVARVKISLCF